ncbi:MAG: DegT/DnrJ/EryC1/StrS family aminotransferase, partial [Acidaminobacteraceae bacterium]
LKYIDGWNIERVRIAELYRKYLSESINITPNYQDDGSHVFHQYVVRVPNRDKVQSLMDKQGIKTLIHYPVPIFDQKAYEELSYIGNEFELTRKLANEVLSLPIYPGLSERDIMKISEVLLKALKDV